MADANQIVCPHCGQSYVVQPEQWAQYQGRTIHCTHCGRPFPVTAPSAPAVGATQPQAVPYFTGIEEPPSHTSGWAVFSVVAGILLFCVPLLGGATAIATGIVGIVKTNRPRVGGRGLAIAGVVLGGLSIVIAVPMEAVMVSIMLPALTRAREQANRVKCASDEKQIGMSLLMYANDHGGKFPDHLADLLTMPSPPSANTFVCPSDTKSPSTANAIAAEQADITSGKCCSYVYVGNGLNVNVDPDTVLLYEPPGDHGGEGMNVLFGDGHVEWMTANEGNSILQQDRKGVRPIKVNGP